MAALREQTFTVEQYLELERTSEIKHEYLDGYIHAMAGASRNHNLIATNTLSSLHAQLRKGPCEVYPSDMRVKADVIYAYPDISVVCGTPAFTGETPDTLTNPILIVEILSPELNERGPKFRHYRTLESLQEILLIEQHSFRIEYYRRKNDSGHWVLRDVVGIDAALELSSIGCTLTLADVYEKVTFEDETSSEEK